MGVAVRMAIVTLILTGIAYPLLATGLAGSFFPYQAKGSLIRVEGRVVGSELIGQRFENPAYFQGRPSAAGADGYDAAASSGSNLGPTSKALRDRIVKDLARLKADNPLSPESVPAELVTASGSGLDPHLSPEAALWQAPRIASQRQVAVADVEALVQQQVEQRTWGILGEPRVNVLLLNLDHDKRYGSPSGKPK
jgi:K+-transporting ATPase ATPase C chain